MNELGGTARRAAGFAALALIMGLAAPAAATTADGVIITNFASCTQYEYNASVVGYPIDYSATAALIVATPQVLFQKDATPTVQASSGTVTYCITFSNSSAWQSAMNVVVEDKIPNGMNYLTGSLVPAPEGWVSGGGSVTASWSSNGGAAWNAGGPASTGNYWLRFTIDFISPSESGYVCYRATIL